jgi:hypothetical protein
MKMMGMPQPSAARCFVQLARLQETLGGFEGCRAKAKRFDEQCCGPADGFIVVNYRN